MDFRHSVVIFLFAIGIVSGIATGFLLVSGTLSLNGSTFGMSTFGRPMFGIPTFGWPTGSDMPKGAINRAPTVTRLPLNGVQPGILNASFEAKEIWEVKKGTRVLLLPHHLVASRQIASLVASTAKPSRVYLIAPDHFSQGTTTLTTLDQAIADVLHIDALRADPLPFIKEHGVTALLPFFDRAWPNIEVIPIIVRIDATEKDRDDLASALIRTLQKDKKAILISSVDFSHDLPAELADFHDLLAQDVVRSLADREADRVELDSPGALNIALQVARVLGLGDVTIHAHTNSLRLMNAKIAQDSTSHIIASFAPGVVRDQETTTLLFLGDMMFDRTVRTRVDASKNPLYTFERIRDSENRFFRGQDLVIGNLEGPVTAKRDLPQKSIDFAFDPSIASTLKKIGLDVVSQANNHALDQGYGGVNESRRLLDEAGLAVFGDQVLDDATSSTVIVERRGKRVAFVGFNTTDNPIDKTAATEAIADAQSAADFVIVFMHWGEEYKDKPNASQVDLAHWFIDQGIDALIGAHPHWMQSVEVYKNKFIAYSLGNFIFDQDWSKETNEGLVVGLAFKKGESTISEAHLFPIRLSLSQPRLLTGDERVERLKRLAEISDPVLAKQIMEGVVRISP